MGAALCGPPGPTQGAGGRPPGLPRGLEAAGNKVFYSSLRLSLGWGHRTPSSWAVWGGGAPQLFLPLPIGTGCLICINLHRSSLGGAACPGEASRGLPSPGLFPGTGVIPGLQPPCHLPAPGGAQRGQEGNLQRRGGAAPAPSVCPVPPDPPQPSLSPPIPFPVLLHSHIPSEQGLEKKNRKAFGQEPPTLVPSPWAPEPPRHHPLPR